MFFAAFLRFDALPIAEDFIGVVCGSVPEDVRVSANEFVADSPDNVFDVELSEVLSDRCDEHYL